MDSPATLVPSPNSFSNGRDNSVAAPCDELSQPFLSQATTLAVYSIGSRPIDESKMSVYHKPLPRKVKKVRKQTNAKDTRTGKESLDKPKKARRKSAPIIKNTQGFDIRKCVPQDDINTCCYVPKGWGTVWKDKKTHKSIEYDPKHFCTKCLLRPCMLLEKHKEIHVEVGCLIEELGEDDTATLNSRMHDFMVDGLVAKIFTKKYAKQVGIPICALEWVDGRFPVEKEEPKLTFSQRLELSLRTHAQLVAGDSDTDSDSEDENERAKWVSNTLSQADALKRYTEM